jgi:hypothetical protein
VRESRYPFVTAFGQAQSHCRKHSEAGSRFYALDPQKVIVRKMDRDSVSGYVSPAQFVNEGKLELLNTSGNVVAMDLREIKGVYFVREFGDSESLTRKTFTSRPRSEGLWVRLRFKDNEILEGLMPSDLTQNLPEGYLVNPPDQRSNTQRIFVPRTALESLTVLSGNRRHPPPKTRPHRRPAPGTDVRGVMIEE